MSSQTEIKGILIQLLRSSEATAHAILANSASVVSLGRQLKQKTEKRWKQHFFSQCRALHDGTQELFKLFHERSSGDIEIPQQLRIERLLAASSAQAEFAGITGTSCCHVTLKYGLRILDCLKDARGKLGNPLTYLDELPNSKLPVLRQNFVLYPAWNSDQIARLRDEVTREVARATSGLAAINVVTELMGNLDPPKKAKPGRKPDPLREKIIETVKAERDKGTPWNDIPAIVKRIHMGRILSVDTLKDYLKPSKALKSKTK